MSGNYVQRYDALTVREGQGENDKSWWTKIGVAFEREGGTITILLDAFPTNGKIVLKVPEERDRQQGERGQYRRGEGGGQRGGGGQRQQGFRGQGFQGGQRGGGQAAQGNRSRYPRQSEPQPPRVSDADFAPEGQGSPGEEFFGGGEAQGPIDDSPF